MNFTIEQIARVTHEANRAIQYLTGDPAPSPAWDEAPDWQREAAISGVDGAQHGSTPEESHQSWLSVKQSLGWVYGEVKDPILKTHPCIVDYDDLPDEQKAKDAVFVAIVRALST